MTDLDFEAVYKALMGFGAPINHAAWNQRHRVFRYCRAVVRWVTRQKILGDEEEAPVAPWLREAARVQIAFRDVGCAWEVVPSQRIFFTDGTESGGDLAPNSVSVACSWETEGVLGIAVEHKNGTVKTLGEMEGNKVSTANTEGRVIIGVVAFSTDMALRGLKVESQNHRGETHLTVF